MTSPWTHDGNSGNLPERVVIKPMETNDELMGRAYVNWQAWRESYTGIIPDGYLVGRTLERCLENSRRQAFDVIVAKDGNAVIGFVSYGRYRDEDMPDAGEIYQLYVLADYKHLGIGSRLMASARDALAGMGFRGMLLWVLEDNVDAVAFYEKHGLVADGSSKVVDYGEPVREIRMACHL